MLPLFLALAGLGIGIAWDPRWAFPWYDARAAVLAAAAAPLLQLAAARLLMRVARRAPDDAAAWPAFISSLIRNANAYRALALPLYAAVIHVFHWPRLVLERIGPVPVAGLLLTLAPFVALLLATFLGLHRAESLARRDRLHLRDYLGFHARMGLLLPLVPAVAVLGLFDLLQASERVRLTLAVYPFLTWIVLLVLSAAGLALAPDLLVRLWKARPLPEGPLLDRFRELCDRAGVRRPRFFVWPTGRFAMVNAMVAGLLPARRTVLFTDAMLAEFAPDELSAVLAHELGHVRHRHLVFYFAMAAGAASFVNFADYAAAPFVGEAARLAGALAFLAALAAGAFGWFSRRFERQADLFAARLVPAPLAVAALEKVALLAGNVRKVWFFTHMSIEQRVNYILEAGTRPENTALFERRLRAARLAGLAFVAFSLGGAMYTVAGQVREAPAARRVFEATELATRAEAAWRAGDPERAIELARRAATVEPAAAIHLGEFLYGSGKPFEAEEAFRLALNEYEPDSEQGLLIRDRLAAIEGLRARRRD
jgi:Zn-dependent protease with chaperone function